MVEVGCGLVLEGWRPLRFQVQWDFAGQNWATKTSMRAWWKGKRAEQPHQNRDVWGRWGRNLGARQDLPTDSFKCAAEAWGLRKAPRPG